MMIHQMTGKDETHILYHMSYARGLQYQNKWLSVNKGIRVFKSSGKSKGLKTIIA